MTQLIGYNLRNISKTMSLLKYLPIDFNIVKKILTSFSNLHVSDGTVYDLNSSRVHELRGRTFFINFDLKCTKKLMTLAETIAEDSTIIQLLHSEFLNYCRHVRKHMKKYSDLFSYTYDIFSSPVKLNQFKELVSYIYGDSIIPYLLF